MKLLDVLRSLEHTIPALTEADTRASLIDPVLAAAGWQSPFLRREPYNNWKHSRGYLDYLLLVREKPFMVIEAKKAGKTFEIPDVLVRNHANSYENVYDAGSTHLREALDQCTEYCAHCGAVYACATNGIDYVFFKPYHPHRAKGHAKVIVFRGTDAMLRRINEFSQLIDRHWLEKGSADQLLVGRELEYPSFAKRLRDAVPVRGGPTIESEEYSRTLDWILNRYIHDLEEPTTFRRCYVPVPANKTTDEALEALVTNYLVSVESELSVPLNNLVKQPSLPGVKAGRMVVLHGPIGCGKSSYLRWAHGALDKDGTLKKAIWAQSNLIDFRDRPFTAVTADSVIDKICKDLRERITDATQTLTGDHDPDEWKHLRDIYNREAREFQKGRFPESNDEDPIYVEAVRQHVWDLKNRDPHAHLVRVLGWLTNKCRIPTIVVLDNSDQLGFEFQEHLYKVAESIQRSTSAVTILTLRTEALASHRLRAHALASVHDRYEIMRPPLITILKRRIEEVQRFVVSTTTDKSRTVKIAMERLSTLLETLHEDARQNGECARIVESAGNGNIRQAMLGLSHIFKLSPQIMDRLVADQARRGKAKLEPKYALRAILRGGRATYRSDDEDCLIPNLLVGSPAIREPQTLPVRILRHVRAKTRLRVVPSIGEVSTDFVLAGEDKELLRTLVERLRSQRLLSVPHMSPTLNETDPVQLTVLAETLLDDWIFDNEYLDAISFDSYIYDETVFREMKKSWTENNLPVRSRFTLVRQEFAAYLRREDTSLMDRLNQDFLEPSAKDPTLFDRKGMS